MRETDNNTVPADRPCGLFRRSLIMLYDGVIVIALWMLATAVALLFGMDNRVAAKDPVYTAFLLTIWFLYLGWCWHKGGMTLGMRAWRVRLQNSAGGLPGWGQCAARFLVSLLSLASLGLGFAWSLFRSDRNTWHDLASGTQLRRMERVKNQA